MEYQEIIYLVSSNKEEDEIGNIKTSSFTLTKRYAKKQSVRKTPPKNHKIDKKQDQLHTDPVKNEYLNCFYAVLLAQQLTINITQRFLKLSTILVDFRSMHLLFLKLSQQ